MKILLTYTYLDTCVECVNNEFFEANESLIKLIDRIAELKLQYCREDFKYAIYEIKDFNLESKDEYIQNFRKLELQKEIKKLEDCEDIYKNHCDYLEECICKMEHEMKVEKEECESKKLRLLELKKIFDLEFGNQNEK